MRAAFVACVAALAVGAMSTTAAADDDKDKARQHFISAQKAMDDGDYAFAAQQFAIAYEYTKDPVLFYRIGKANHLAGDCQTALVYYKRYLKEANPDEEFTKLTNELITECNKALGKDTGGTGTDTGGTGTTGDDDDDGVGTGIMLPGDDDDDTTPPDDPVKPPSFSDDKPTWKRTAAWVSVGLTVAAVTTGAVLGLSASSREEDIENLISFRDAQGNPATFDGNTKERYEELIDEGDRLNSLSIVAFGVAGAAAAAAVVFFILDSTSGGDEQPVASGYNLAPVVTADGGLGVSAGWSF